MAHGMGGLLVGALRSFRGGFWQRTPAERLTNQMQQCIEQPWVISCWEEGLGGDVPPLNAAHSMAGFLVYYKDCRGGPIPITSCPFFFWRYKQLVMTVINTVETRSNPRTLPTKSPIPESHIKIVAWSSLKEKNKMEATADELFELWKCSGIHGLWPFCRCNLAFKTLSSRCQSQIRCLLLQLIADIRSPSRTGSTERQAMLFATEMGSCILNIKWLKSFGSNSDEQYAFIKHAHGSSGH